MHDWHSEVRARLVPLRLKPAREADIVDEIAQHLAERYREAISAGASPEEAIRVALGEFRTGNALAQRIAALKQAHAPAGVTAGASTGRLFADLRQDLRFALRAFAKQRAFTATAVLIIALGIGATTAIFSVVNAVVIKPLPYPDADAIVRVAHSAVTGGVRGDGSNFGFFSAQTWELYATDGRAFDELGMYRSGQATITGLTDLERANTLVVTESIVRVLGVPPALGRWFSREDDQPGAADTAILSDGYWRRRFGRDRSVIGSTITIDGRPTEVIGVMPARFTLRELPVDLILPMRTNAAQPGAVGFCCSAVARLKPGITVADANADVDRMLPGYIDRDLRPAAGAMADALQLRAAVRPLKEDVVGNVGQVLWVLLGSISILLLIACANVANLVLVRAETRGTELALRTVLGARAGRLARGLMVESLTLSLIGGLIGVGLAYGGLRILLAFPPANLPRLNEIAIDLPVLGFALGVSVLSGLLFGLVPILRVAGHRSSNLAEAVRAGGRGASAGKHQYRSQNTLVVAQVALALVMLVASGLMLRSFQNLRSVEPGFADPATVQTVRASMPRTLESERLVGAQQQILERLAAIPGITSAAYTTLLPMEGGGGFIVALEGERYESGRLPPSRRIVGVSPGLLRTLGTPLLAGRDVDWTELQEQRNVALVSESFAREAWNTIEGAVGKRIDVGADGSLTDVIGVVADAYHDGVDRPAPQTIYWPARPQELLINGAYSEPRAVVFTLRSDRTGTESMLGEIRRAVAEVAPEVVITEIDTLAQVYRDHPSMARRSFSLALLGIAGAMALLLSVVGIYGVLAYAVVQRQREVGIRVALGAAPRSVKGLFVYRGMVLASIGIVVGAVAAAALTRLMSSLLFGVTPLDVATFVVAAAFLAAAALLASYVPARRAATIDPMETLRAE
jgi:putative ABC transport system permease protein